MRILWQGKTCEQTHRAISDILVLGDEFHYEHVKVMKTEKLETHLQFPAPLSPFAPSDF